MYSHQTYSDERGPRDLNEEPIQEALEQIVFQVNTPTFFSRFFHYKSPFAAIQSELLDDEPTRTVWSSHPQEFAALFPHDIADTCRQPLNWRWRIISILRTAPLKTSFSRQTAYESCTGISLIDHLIMQQCSKRQFRDYRRALIRLFLGHWIGGFSIGTIREGDFELIGLSRDAILMIYEALLKAGLVSLGIFVAGDCAIEATTFTNLLVQMLGMAGLNIWACSRSVL
jgi:hypothetical protein